MKYEHPPISSMKKKPQEGLKEYPFSAVRQLMHAESYEKVTRQYIAKAPFAINLSIEEVTDEEMSDYFYSPSPISTTESMKKEEMSDYHLYLPSPTPMSPHPSSQCTKTEDSDYSNYSNLSYTLLPSPTPPIQSIEKMEESGEYSYRPFPTRMSLASIPPPAQISSRPIQSAKRRLVLPPILLPYLEPRILVEPPNPFRKRELSRAMQNYLGNIRLAPLKPRMAKQRVQKPQQQISRKQIASGGAKLLRPLKTQTTKQKRKNQAPHKPSLEAKPSPAHSPTPTPSPTTTGFLNIFNDSIAPNISSLFSDWSSNSNSKHPPRALSRNTSSIGSNPFENFEEFEDFWQRARERRDGPRLEATPSLSPMSRFP